MGDIAALHSHLFYNFFFYSPSLDASVHHLVRRSLQVVCGTEMCEMHSEQPLKDLDPIPPVMIRLYTCTIYISGSIQS